MWVFFTECKSKQRKQRRFFCRAIYTQLIKKSNENSRWLPVKLSQVELKCIVFRSDEYTRSKMFRSHDDWQILSRPIKEIFFLSSQCSIFQVSVFFYFPTNFCNKIIRFILYTIVSKKRIKKTLRRKRKTISEYKSRVWEFFLTVRQLAPETLVRTLPSNFLSRNSSSLTLAITLGNFSQLPTA